MISVRLSVNDEPTEVRVGPTDTLLTTLREQLHLNGAKRGCDYGVCGACTIWIDGRPMRSCLALTWNCAGRTITTVESLDASGELAPIQAALLAAGGVQCGFCTGGVVMTAHALLAANPQPTRAEVREALSANACRCSGFGAIVDAVMAVAHAPSKGVTA